MITYRKKSLKVHSIFAKDKPPQSTGAPFFYTVWIAEQLKKFIEKGEYGRIVDITHLGRGDARTCTIIYEESAKGRENVS